jgi:hypothetical protein
MQKKSIATRHGCCRGGVVFSNVAVSSVADAARVGSDRRMQSHLADERGRGCTWLRSQHRWPVGVRGRDCVAANTILARIAAPDLSALGSEYRNGDAIRTGTVAGYGRICTAGAGARHRRRCIKRSCRRRIWCAVQLRVGAKWRRILASMLSPVSG